MPKFPNGKSNTTRIVRVLCTLLLPLALVVFALPGTANADGAAAPTITSDQADYSPGSTVVLTSAGWAPDEAVHVSVDDSDGQSWHFQDDVTADATGSFTEQLVLPDWFVANYAVQAVGSSGAIASTTFTDSNVNVNAVKAGTSTNLAVDVIWTTFKKDATCTGTPQTSSKVTTGLTGNGFVKTNGVGQQTGMTLLAPQNIVSGSTIWALSGWSGGVTSTANPVCVPGDTGNGTIRETASYTDTGVPANNKQAQTISFAVIQDVNYPVADFDPAATASSGLAVTYAASPSTVCTITATQLVHIVGVGDCTVTASQGGNSSYLAATDVSRTFSVLAATTTVTVNCPASVVYTGIAQTPCTATATAAGGFSQGVSVTYSADNTNVGTVTASASFAGDGTHAAGSGSTTFAITQATSTVSISCGAATYDGTQQQPCTAAALGAGLGTSGVSLTPSYGNNTNAGTNTATVSASWSGDTNHTGSSANTTFSIAKATSTTSITCTSPVIYTGSAIAACGTTASVTGAGGLATTTPVTYPGNNTAVATGVEADANYAGDANHLSSSDVKTFDITQASSTVSVTCSDAVYDTTAHMPCTAEVNGPGLHITGLTVTYANNVNAGQASASASWAGDANHTGNSTTVYFTIAKADTSISINCTAGSVYDGSAKTPCSATVTGTGLSGDVSVTYANNVAAGTASASAHYDATDNYNSSDASTTFSIAKATSTVTVDCSGTFVYNSHPQQPCSASVSGAGGLTGTVGVSYPADTTDAGQVNVSATYGGDDNHLASTGYGSYTIAKADTTTTVTCNGPVTYNGLAQTPCSASVTGPALNQSLDVSYTDNVNATLSAGASASFAGDSNYNASSDSESFVINQASSTTTVNCPAHVTYSGSALTPCSASATGAGGLNADVTSSIVYSNNIVVGTGGASASFAGDQNHTSSNGSGSFTIDKADVTVSVTCPASVVYNGYAQTPCGATLSGPGLVTQNLTPSYSNNQNVTTTASASASWPGDANHNSGSDSKTFAITQAPLTVTAVAKTMTYGDAVPTLTYGITGFLGGDSVGNSTTGTASCTTTATSSSPAGQYPITCSRGTLGSTNYSFSYVGAQLTVNTKGATLGYTGSLFFATASATATSTSVTLQGQLTPAAGGSPSLLNGTPITFNLYKSTNTAMSTTDATCVTSNINASGVFTCTIANLGVDNWTVIAHLGSPGNTYFNAPDSDPVVVTVYQPGTDAFATGGGWVTDPSSNVSPLNQHGNFGFTVRYKGSSPSGQAVFVYRGADGYDYVVKSNSWQGGGLAFGAVSGTVSNTSFSGKANVTVINRATGQVVASYGNYTFRVDAVDNGSPSTADTYAISVYNSAGVLYHQAGTANSQLKLGGGNIVIHAK